MAASIRIRFRSLRCLVPSEGGGDRAGVVQAEQERWKIRGSESVEFGNHWIQAGYRLHGGTTVGRWMESKKMCAGRPVWLPDGFDGKKDVDVPPI